MVNMEGRSPSANHCARAHRFHLLSQVRQALWAVRQLVSSRAEGSQRMAFDLLIRGGIAVLPWGMEQTDIGVRDGRIAALGVPSSAEAMETINASGLHVLPGLIDPH